MAKRSRSGDSKNPLSSARRDGRATTGNSKADAEARSLWHRKTGAGYHLFITYYGSQPMGVVAAGDINFAAADTNASIANKSSIGMSRAAKKRRKKKSTGNDVAIVAHAKSSDVTNEAAKLRQRPNDNSHPLIEAFASAKNKQYKHLHHFIDTMSRPLPLTLRFREHDQSTRATGLRHLLENEHSDLISPVSYDPSNCIYQATPGTSLCKANLSKLSPALKDLIVSASMDGTLARQELGSILPVHTLRSVGAIKAGAKVLDLCASPGSKTMQALEIVCGKECNGGKGGKIVANDVHSGRLDSLREAVLRSGLPDSLTSRITYTNYDASAFPLPKSGKLFDAIICDVPCGGDGTIRKDKHILPMWTPKISNELHSLQLKILRRALSLCKVGGCVCYSTCSLNPIEDEAVVLAALGREGNIAFELLDWPANTLPGFLRRPGVGNWKVAFYEPNSLDKEEDDFGSISFFGSHEDAVAAGRTDAEETFWPDAAQNKRLPLERCTRLLPQDQDTGGFFLAVIKRLS